MISRISSDIVKGEGATSTSFDFMEDTPLGPEGTARGGRARGSGVVPIGTTRRRQKVASLVELLQELSVPHQRRSSTARGWTGATSDMQGIDQQNALDQQRPRQESVGPAPTLSGPSRTIAHRDISSNDEKNGRRSGADRETQGTGCYFGTILDNTSEHASSVGAFAGSGSQSCPAISPEAVYVGGVRGGTNSPKERSVRRRRLDGGHRDIVRALESREDKNQWLTQVDSRTSSIWKQQYYGGDSAQRKTEKSVPQGRRIQAIGENRGRRPAQQDRPDVVPIGLQRTNGIVVDADTGPGDEAPTEPDMDDSSFAQYDLDFTRVGQECDRDVGAVDAVHQADGGKGSSTKELLRVCGLCRVRGAILVLVEWNVVDAVGATCQELSFMLSSTLKIEWPQQYIAYLEEKLVFRSEDDVEESQRLRSTTDTEDGAGTDHVANDAR